MQSPSSTRQTIKSRTETASEQERNKTVKRNETGSHTQNIDSQWVGQEGKEKVFFSPQLTHTHTKKKQKYGWLARLMPVMGDYSDDNVVCLGMLPTQTGDSVTTESYDRSL